MTNPPTVKTMRLRYAGACEECSRALPAGETAHYIRTRKSVRCLSCGPSADAGLEGGQPLPPPPPAAVAPEPVSTSNTEDVELVEGELTRAADCGDCGRRLRRGSEALHSECGSAVLCLECVTLDALHSLGVAGAGARREHAKRLDRHQTRVRTAHPKLGGLILALKDDPTHVRAWQTGAVGEEEFGRRLSGIACQRLKVLHDRKLPRSSANIDHLAVTGKAVWILDSKRYKGRVETRGHGLFSRQPPDLYVGGRNQMKLVEGVQRQVAAVESVLAEFAAEQGLGKIPVRGALVFINAEFGLFSSPFAVDGVWVGWGKEMRKRLSEQGDGQLPVPDVAKRLAREFRPG